MENTVELLKELTSVVGVSGAEENIGRKSDNSIDRAILQKMFTDSALTCTSEQYAMRQDNSHSAFILQMIEAMKQERKICF